MAEATSIRRELLIGCGPRERWRKFIHVPEHKEWSNLTTLDFNGDHSPDVIHDLETLPYPFKDDSFDEIHAYDVLEHTGQQGDWKFFFAQFAEFFRILKPDGKIFGACPLASSRWAWGDPSHKRIISECCLIFLDQDEYVKQMGKTAMTDFRFIWKGDLKLDYAFPNKQEEKFEFVLRAHKPTQKQSIQFN